jgi:hypothetical protein
VREADRPDSRRIRTLFLSNPKILAVCATRAAGAPLAQSCKQQIGGSLNIPTLTLEVAT